MLRRVLRLFGTDTPRPSRPKPSRRPVADRMPFRDHEPMRCPACAMLLGAVALRRGRCPRCRAPFTGETG